MCTRGIQLGGDLDNLAYAKQEEFDAILKKFCATKNCKPDTAMRWALQRALNEEARTFIRGKMQDYFNSQVGLI